MKNKLKLTVEVEINLPENFEVKGNKIYRYGKEEMLPVVLFIGDDSHPVSALNFSVKDYLNTAIEKIY